MNEQAETFPLEIDCRAVKEKLDTAEDFLLLDCRRPEEVQAVHIEGSHWIPMEQIQQRVDELSPHRDRNVVVHCHLGGRSLQVAQWLRQQGFSQAQSMAGGIDVWAVEIDPTLPRYS